jgi:hypothetical protein
MSEIRVININDYNELNIKMYQFLYQRLLPDETPAWFNPDVVQNNKPRKRS